MNKKFKLASAFLATNLLVIPISGIISQNDNVAKAESISEYKISNKDIEEGLIIKDYIILQKKDGIYQFNFYNDQYLNSRLKEIGSKLTDKDINAHVAALNDKLIQENGNGELNDAIKELQYYAKLNSKKNLKFRSICGNTFTWVAFAHSTFYGFAIGGPVGTGLGVFTGLAYAVGSTIACP